MRVKLDSTMSRMGVGGQLENDKIATPAAPSGVELLVSSGMSAAHVKLLGANFESSLGALAKPGARPQAQLKAEMRAHLDVVAHFYRELYAPAAWKKELSGWTLDEALNAAKAKIAKAKDITVRDYRAILRDFIHSMKDYHVSVTFNSTESASLPIVIKNVKDGSKGTEKFVIALIDRTKLPESDFPFKPGDEVVAFGGRPTAEVVSELEKEIGSNVPETDRALATMALTSRSGRRGMTVPESKLVTIEIKPQGATRTHTHQLGWKYQPEGMVGVGKSGEKPEASAVRQAVLGSDKFMAQNVEQLTTMNGELHPFSLGGKRSFVPRLGPVVSESEPGSLFDSYIYKGADGKLIGYIRIPSYSVEDEDAHIAEFAKLIKRYEQVTDGLVIDQNNNPGGSVFYLYSLVSMLSDQTIDPPRHRMSLTSDIVSRAQQIIAALSGVSSDAEAKKILGKTMAGFPVSYDFVQKQLAYARFILSEAEAGKTLSDPFHIGGVDKINPSTEARYTKPIVVLVNELDFSGGDFFPATLQDNGRATIMGTRTAGAGGYVLRHSFPNFLGVESFSITGSIAERKSGKPIENLGVKPDIGYALTDADYKNGFAHYATAINVVAHALIAKAAAEAKGKESAAAGAKAKKA